MGWYGVHVNTRREAAAAASVLVALIAVIAAGCTGPRRPAPPADYGWSFGGDRFGHWITDAFGLPAFAYTANEATDRAARWNDGNGTSTSFWHQLGNGRVVADAFNDGYVELWDGERQYRSSNYYDAAAQQFAGGFGYLRAGRVSWSTLYLDRPAGSGYRRLFGMGYYEKDERANGLQANQTIFAPSGTDPVLLSQVTIRNVSAQPKTVHYFEYWGVNPEVVPAGFASTGPSVAQPPSVARYLPGSRTLVALPAGGVSPVPHALFLSSLTDPVAGYETSVTRFFGSGSRAKPAEVVNGALPGRLSAGRPAMFAMEATIRLVPHQAHTLVYAYGYGDAPAIPALVARLAAGARTALTSSEAAWRQSLPRLSVPENTWLAREAAWDYYYLRSSATYEDAWHTYLVNQGYAYEYYWGLNIAYRDVLQAVLPLAYLVPELARQSLIFGLRAQPPSGQIPYGFVNGTPFDLSPGYRADDMDLWLLWAASQYVLATRDFGFLRQRQPFLGTTRSGTVLQHLELAFGHQLSAIGFGPHGEFRMLGGDWSDGEGRTGATESTPTTAQAAWVFSYFAQLAQEAGQAKLARQASAEAAALRQVVARQWTGHWFNRGYQGARAYGVDSLYLNAQPWAILSGAATRGRAPSVARSIGTLLSDPSPIGAASQSRSQGYGPAREKANGTGTTGGVWFALNGPDVWALGPVNPALAYREYKDTTHAAYAQAYPGNWFGVLSGPDSYDSFESATAGQPSIPMYPVQDSLSSAWELFDTTAEAGIQATGGGYTIDPHWPFPDFSWDTGVLGVTYAPGGARGYVRVASPGTVTMRVRVPGGTGSHLTLRAGGRTLALTAHGGYVQWIMNVGASQPAAWSLARS